MAEPDKRRAIENVVLQIEKQFGKGAIMKLGEAQQRMAVDAIPTGSIALDIALGVGGMPRGLHPFLPLVHYEVDVGPAGRVRVERRSIA
jgi:hypothetical protein